MSAPLLRPFESPSTSNSAIGPGDSVGMQSPVVCKVDVLGGRRDAPRRLLDRTAPGFQSNGKFDIDRGGRPLPLYLRDPFHSLLHIATPKLTILVTAMYFIGFALFTIPYYAAIGHCGTDWKTWTGAFMFSVETMMTIGYGATDPTFEDCLSMSLLISFQSVLGTMFDAIAIGIIYDRLSRPMSRATTVFFSRDAVFRKVQGQWTFEFRVGELRKHQLVEAHVRLYAVAHRFDSKGNIVEPFATSYVRTHDPDDEVGGMLFLPIPQFVRHVVSAPSSETVPFTRRSPLLPSQPYLTAAARWRRSDVGQSTWTRAVAEVPTVPSSPTLLEQLASLRSRPIRTSTSAAVTSRWAPPSTYQAPPTSPYSPSHSGRGRAVESLQDEFSSAVAHTSDGATIPWRVVEQYWRDAELEVVVVLEGIDAATSDTLCARHSYTADDVLFMRKFVPCVSRGSAGAVIDFAKLHTVTPVAVRPAGEEDDDGWSGAEGGPDDDGDDGDGDGADGETKGSG